MSNDSGLRTWRQAHSPPPTLHWNSPRQRAGSGDEEAKLLTHQRPPSPQVKTSDQLPEKQEYGKESITTSSSARSLVFMTLCSPYVAVKGSLRVQILCRTAGPVKYEAQGLSIYREKKNLGSKSDLCHKYSKTLFFFCS